MDKSRDKFVSRPAIRDSFDDEEASDDVDDEVFIRDGRNGYKLDEENGLKKPLMPPRRRHLHAKLTSNGNGGNHESIGTIRRKCSMFLAPCCVGFTALSFLLGLIAISIILINYFSLSLSGFHFWVGKTSKPQAKKTIPCMEFAVTDVWLQTFPKLTSETALRLNDVNNDGVFDVIMGFGTGLDGRNVPDFVCTLYFGRDPPCLGGIVALDGKTGKVLWQHWTHRPVFSVDCSADLTEDSVNDCVVGGKGGLLHVVNGHDGCLLWHLEDGLNRQQLQVVQNVYSAQYIPDIDDDGFIDVIASHTISDSSGTSVKGHLIVVSGKAGRLLRMIEMPGGSESYYPPQLLVHSDGEKIILLGTGGTAGHSWGGLHAIPLSQLAASDKVLFNTIVTSDTRGVMSPPVLVDINHDGTEDIVVSLFNSSVVAVDGKALTTLWNYTFTNSQTFSPPTPGYFNDDNVPDFLVKYQNGPDFPVYFFSEMNILDGKTGCPLLNQSVIDSVGSQMGGLTISVEGYGNDWMLYWTANCLGHEGSQSPFSFARGSSMVSQSQADLCLLRFNSSMTATLWALNRHIKAPGFPIYSTDGREAIEYNNSEKIFGEAQRYLAKHPDFWINLRAEESKQPTNADGLLAEEAKSDKVPPAYAGNSFLSDPSKSISSLDRGRGGEAEEVEEADYSPLQIHHVGKHHKPYGSILNPKAWQLEKASKNYGPFYGSQPVDSTDQDYESPVLPRQESPRTDNEYGSYLSNAGNEGVELAASNLANILQNQLHEKAGNLQRRVRDTILRESQEKLKKFKRKRLRRKATDKLDGNDLKSDIRKKTNSSSTVHSAPKGIYPITSTGTLTPALSGSGIDLIFVSYWIPPSEGVQILTEKDMECVKQSMETTADSEKYANMNQETLEIAVTAECLYERLSTSAFSSGPSNHGRSEPHPGFIPKATSESSAAYDPLNLRLGQLTVYRLNLQCKCQKPKEDEVCAQILPFSKQSWPSFMGHEGRGYFNPKS